ncbi:MAG: SGNH/GDSL hydrolase family protein [Oscillospiraceae bacterium]|nr:SGNH/GDSL hydrolase family protein [Oscillospiraceae bacterium]
MILSKEQIKSISKGVLYWSEGIEDGLIPHRYSAQQEQFYRGNPNRYVRTFASSGVRLECRTDAAALELSARVFKGSGMDWHGFDLMVNGLLWGHHEGTLEETDHIHWVLPLPEGEKTVLLHLPCLAGAEILNVTLQGATFCQPVEYKEKILFMGDSITQGYHSHFPSLTYPAQVAAYRNAEILNQGNGGEIFNPPIVMPLDWEPTMAVIAYGTNDWSTTDRERTTQRATEFLNRFCQFWPGLPTFVISPLWRADFLTRRDDDFKQAEVKEILQRAAEKNPQIRVIDGHDLVPRIEALMYDARLHPNELGFTIYAKRLAAALDQLYPKK